MASYLAFAVIPLLLAAIYLVVWRKGKADPSRAGGGAAAGPKIRTLRFLLYLVGFFAFMDFYFFLRGDR